MLSAWALPAQRRAIWAAVAGRKGSPEKAAVHELVLAALKSSKMPLAEKTGL